jgi:uncharacterized YigZ family protein
MDTYKTILSKSEGFFISKGSKFISYAFPVASEVQIKGILNQVKKEHHGARHHCYAWRLGPGEPSFRVSDDGEPSSTAGKPILGQIIQFDVTNILIVVVRYFGGILLGTSGLIVAYRSAAFNALVNATIVNRIIEKHFRLKFAYNKMNDVMMIIKQEKLSVISTKFELGCLLDFMVRESESSRIVQLFERLSHVNIEEAGDHDPVDK